MYWVNGNNVYENYHYLARCIEVYIKVPIKILLTFSFNKSEILVFLAILISLHSLDLIRLAWSVIEPLHLLYN